MKHFYFLFVLLTLFVLGGCGKGQSIAPVGTWLEMKTDDHRICGEHRHRYEFAGEAHFYVHDHCYYFVRHDHPKEKTYRSGGRRSRFEYRPKKFKKREVLKPREQRRTGSRLDDSSQEIKFDEKRFEEPFLKK